jgi:large-conductance mechanosensitive channel
MGLFDPANPEERQEGDLQAVVSLLTEIRDLLQKYLSGGQSPS